MRPAPDTPPGRPGSTRALVALLAFVLGFATVPHRVCERDARKWLGDDKELTDALANGVARWTEEPLSAAQFSTGSARFDGEWMFGTYVMAALGFGQVALAHPEEREARIAQMEHCLDRLEEPSLRAFDREGWGDDAIETLDGSRGHLAYLGYAAVAYALHEQLGGNSRFSTRERAIIATLERRIIQSPTGFVETYPGETYPVDNATAAAALAIHGRLDGRRSPALQKVLKSLRDAVDPNTYLLNQAVSSRDATPRDGPRTSGTALAAYLLSFADADFSRMLFGVLERQQFRTVLGFGAMMEHPPAAKGGKSDIDSGPIVLGFGVSATGFALGASKVNGDAVTFTALYATAHLFGCPFDENGARTYATGGPIGDAILFAMLTAVPPGKM